MDKYLSKSKPSASAARQNPRSSKQAPETSSSPLSVVTNAPNPGQLYITCSTGHQVDGGPTRDKNYWDTRNGKLKSQGRAVREEYKKTVGSSGPLDKGILRDVVVYVNGEYLLEMVDVSDIRLYWTSNPRCGAKAPRPSARWYRDSESIHEEMYSCHCFDGSQCFKD